jgi:hypothetical protein
MAREGKVVVTSVPCLSHIYGNRIHVGLNLLDMVVRAWRGKYSGNVILLDLEESAAYGPPMEPAVYGSRSQLAVHHFLVGNVDVTAQEMQELHTIRLQQVSLMRKMVWVSYNASSLLPSSEIGCQDALTRDH